jgi:protein-S-isoprenylcysteine O-methyltransferase Ste14
MGHNCRGGPPWPPQRRHLDMTNNDSVSLSRVIGSFFYLLLSRHTILPRRPLYAGATLLFISAPLLQRSIIGLVLDLVLILTIGARVVGEEAMLKEELEGYRDYMRKVKWRMIPYVF